MEIKFTDGDFVRFAHSPAEAVRLRGAGWLEVDDVEPQVTAPEVVEPADVEPQVTDEDPEVVEEPETPIN